MGMKHSSRCLLLRRKMAENAAENTEVRRRGAPGARRPRLPADRRLPRRRRRRRSQHPEPNFPQLHLACSCRPCACVCWGGGDGALLRSPLGKCKRVALTPSPSPAARCCLLLFTPSPQSRAVALPAPCPAPLGLQSADLEQRGAGRSRGRVCPLQCPDCLLPCPRFTLQAAPRTAPGRARQRQAGGGGTRAPSTDPLAQIREREACHRRMSEPSRER